MSALPFRVILHNDLPPDLWMILPGGMSDELARLVAIEVADRQARSAVAPNPVPSKE